MIVSRSRYFPVPYSIILLSNVVKKMGLFYQTFFMILSLSFSKMGEQQA